MILGAESNADSGSPARDEKDAGDSGDPGPEASWRTGRGRVPALRPIHDHAKPGYPPPLHLPQCRPPLCLPQGVPLA